MAWHSLSWEPVAFSEIEKFPSAVLAHHYPDVPNWGDMTKFKEWPDATVDVLVGGTPCQSFSVAGLRKGLADPRGNLALTYLAIADKYRPSWLVWENVPGVLSADGGRAFGAILGGMGELGYGFAYRVLDAQFVRTRGFPGAVPQRRRRVFVVAHLGDWRRSAAVLFDAESLRGNPPPGREAGQAAPTIPSRSTAGGGLGTDFDCDGGLVGDEVRHFECSRCGEPFTSSRERPCRRCLSADVFEFFPEQEIKKDRASGLKFKCVDCGESFDGCWYGDACLSCGSGMFLPIHTPRWHKVLPSVANPLTHRMHKGINSTLDEGQTPIPVAFDLNQITSKTNRSQPDPAVHHTLPATTCPPHLASPMAVRRLTPIECERLQGFPDNFTRIPWRNKQAEQCPDGPRYKALGNSMAVNVMQWLGQRIQMVSEMEQAA